MLLVFIKMLIFPGLLFLGAYAMICEFVDRKVYARLQNRVGPPWYQPAADFFKLIGKETVVPSEANRGMFMALPVVSLTAVAAAYIYLPIFGKSASFAFEGDLIIVLYLLTVPAIALFLGGWYSRGVYATLGSSRVLTSMFAYEVPLFMALLAPALIAGTWSISGITAFYAAHPLYTLFNIPALLVALIAGQGKLERNPFDAPEAESEIVSGALVEYGGRLLAIFRLSVDFELVVVSSIIAAIFLPFMTGIAGVDFVLYLVKTMVVLLALSVLRAAMARVRIDQMVGFCWKILTPVAAAQIILNLIVRGGLQL